MRELFRFANTVADLGLRRNIGSCVVVPLPPAADETVATYRSSTGEYVCVWPINNDQIAADVEAAAHRHSMSLVRYGRPDAPAEGEADG